MTPLIKKLSERKTLLIFATLYTVVVTIALLLPAGGLPRIDFIPVDKLVHICIHVGLVLLWLFYGYKLKNHQGLFPLIIIVVVACLLYGIIIEVLQDKYTVTRQADIMDVLANVLGSIIGIFLFLRTKQRFKT
ncbi:VanZ family protein [Ulvibacter sp. MAR_2010_11]|uniref:VanZ family protein n=1 Tax=Ulvibacter sp. MAR_2010_11 TaxID=1250229 RepID=UPI000C2CC7C2|nr:VanZ family protein [Ulvibacter sp. MAR_2010_11]PKA83258.1 VanZ family protein [Ulvibacter sp. MAR_2010_11]